MKLPIKLPELFEKKPQAEYFLALLLRDEKASAVIVEEIAGKIKVVGRHEVFFGTTLEQAEQQELLDVIDKAISRAEETLPANVQTEKTIFGVKDTWVEEKKIKKEYLAKLKAVSDELHLTPIGFLVISEAIAHLIQREEGAPVSAILTEIGTKTVTLSLLRAGKLLETKSAALTDSPTKAVDSLLKHFEKAEVLPSRIIIFNAKNDDEISQQFIAHQWSKSLPFLHMPQISILPAGFDTKAVLYGAATQMGFEIVGISMDTPIRTTAADIPHLSQEAHHEEAVAEEIDEIPTPEETTKTPAATMAAATLTDFPTETFGFVFNQDIAEMPEPPVEEKALTEEATTVAEQAPTHIAAEQHDYAPEHHNLQEIAEPPTHHPHADKHARSAAFSFAVITPFIANLKKYVPTRLPSHFTMPQFKNGNKMLLIPPVILLMLVLGIVWYVFKLQATVVLGLTPKIAEETQKITFSTSADNNFSQGLIAAKKVSTDIEGSTTVDATGKKDIGDKAKGTVTIFNSADSRKVLHEGTTITSSNGLAFVLDKDVTVSSSSGDIFSGIKSGTAQVNVTAKNIGTEYNLPSNTKFTISGDSSLAAKNDSAFAGGTKKSVVVVAKADVDKALADLPDATTNKAKEKITHDLGSGYVLLPEFLETSVKDKTLDNEIGEEAKSVTVTATIHYEGAAYHQDDLTAFAQSILKDKFSQDTNIPEKNIQYNITNISQKSDKDITANVVIKAGLLPKIDEKEVAAKITGMSFADAEETLKKLPQVDKTTITLSPDLPLLPRVLPRVANNIKVTITTNE